MVAIQGCCSHSYFENTNFALVAWASNHTLPLGQLSKGRHARSWGGALWLWKHALSSLLK